MVTGLAWTEVGGELLTVEGVMMPGKGKMTVTGNLRDVMKESISAAASYVRSRAVDFGIGAADLRKSAISTSTCRKAPRRRYGPSAGTGPWSPRIVSVMTGHPGPQGRGDDG